jgi:hypothetical protein
MLNNNRSIVLKIEHLSYIFMAFLLLLYSVYRSYSLSFTHDESYSFINIIHGSFYQVVSNDSYWISANNHIFNSLCMKYAEILFGPTEFNLRLHSIIAHVLYLLFTFLIVKEIKPTRLQIVCFIVLNFNPYLLDFFSLARGYALSIAFMTMSVYFFIQFTKKESILSVSICLLAALLATLANFSLITFTVSIIILFECFMIMKRYSLKEFLLKNVPIVISTLCLYSLYRWPITQLINHGQLFFGGEEGLWSDTVISSIEVYLYHSTNFDFFKLCLKFFIITIVILHICMFYKRIKEKNIQALDYVFIIMILILSINYTQHFFMNTSYFKERFAMFLVPLFFISSINCFIFLYEINFGLKIVSSVFALAIALIAGSVCKDSLNLSYTYNWLYDANTKEMLNDLSLSKAEYNAPVKLGITWLFEPSINFYIETKKIQGLLPVNRDGVKGEYDFYYVDKDELPSFDKSDKIILKSYKTAGSALFRKIK